MVIQEVIRKKVERVMERENDAEKGRNKREIKKVKSDVETGKKVKKGKEEKDK